VAPDAGNAAGVSFLPCASCPSRARRSPRRPWPSAPP